MHSSHRSGIHTISKTLDNCQDIMILRIHQHSGDRIHVYDGELPSREFKD